MRSGLLLLAVVRLAAQDAAADPLLARVRARVLDEVQKLPKYTCVQTLDRMHLPLTARTHDCGASLATLDSAAIADTNRVRLDVAFGSAGEVFSWPGGGRLDAANLASLAGTPAGTGAFGPFLIDIFSNLRTAIERRDDDGGYARYHYTVRQFDSHYQVLLNGVPFSLAFSGEFWVDRESAAITRLKVAFGTQPALSVCSAATLVDFHRVTIGAGEYFLPGTSLMDVVLAGDRYQNRTFYENCREYHAESAIHFGDDAADPAAAPKPAASTAPFPSGRHVRLALLNPIDFAVDAAGDPVAARVVDGAAPAGAIVRGRITQLEHHIAAPSYFQLSVQFETIEIDGTAVPVSATLDPKGGEFDALTISAHNPGAARSMPPLRRNMPYSGGRTIVLPSTDPTFVIARGWESRWITAAPAAR